MKKVSLALVLGLLFFAADVYAAGGDLTVSGTVSAATLSVPNVMTKFYDSGEQPIGGTNGVLTLNHGLGTEPILVQVLLICKTSPSCEGNYLNGEKVLVNPGAEYSSGNVRGMSVVPTETQLKVRFAVPPIVFDLIDRNTGGPLGLTNNNGWKIIFRAWAM